MIQEEGFDPIYGARPLNEIYSNLKLKPNLLKKLLKEHVHQGQHVEVDYQDGLF